jgi:glutamyl-tRNA reductase
MVCHWPGLIKSNKTRQLFSVIGIPYGSISTSFGVMQGATSPKDLMIIDNIRNHSPKNGKDRCLDTESIIFDKPTEPPGIQNRFLVMSENRCPVVHDLAASDECPPVKGKSVCPHSNLRGLSEGRSCGYHSYMERGGIIPAPFGVVGLSHRTASAELRNRASISGDQTQGFLRMAIESGLTECVVLSTCNRTEIYYSASDVAIVRKLIADHAGVPLAELQPHLFEKACVCAACHLFRVVSGLDSVVLGETEIVAQVKDAWKRSTELGTSGPTLDLLFQRGLEASKRVRSESELCRNVTSTGSLAVREAAKGAVPLRDATVLVVGAGKIAERILKDLAVAGAQHVSVLNRTLDHAVELAARFGVKAASLEELPSAIKKADVVFGTIGASTPVITEAMLGTSVQDSLVVVDLGVPPCVENGVNISNVRVVRLDDLKETCDDNSVRRQSAVPDALAILDQELDRFGPALAERAAAPTIRALMERGEEIRNRNLAWAKDRIGDVSDKQWRIVEELAKRMTLGLLQTPIDGLKSHLASAQHRDVVERLFDLQTDGSNLTTHQEGVNYP